MTSELKITHSTIKLLLGGAGLIFLAYFLIANPAFIWLTGLLILPGFLLTFSFSKQDFTVLERIALGLPITNMFLITLQILSTLGIRLSLTGILCLTLALPLILAATNHRHFRSSLSSAQHINLSEAGHAIFIIAVAVCGTMLIWGSLLQDQKLPLTDQVVIQSFIQTHRDTIQHYGRLPYWTSEYSGGFPIDLFDSPFFYIRCAVDWLLFPGHNATFHMNYYSFLCLAITLIGLYCLARRLSWSKTAGVVAMLAFISSPLLASKLGYSGDMKELTAFAIFPILFVVFMLCLEKRKLPHYLLLALIISSYYFTNLIPLIPAFIMMGAFVLYKAQKKELISRRESIGFALAVVITLLLVGINLFPQLAASAYNSASGWKFDYSKNLFTDIIKPMVSNPVTQPYDQYSHGQGMLFGILAIAGMALSLVLYRMRKENFFLIGFWIAVFGYVIPLLNIPLGLVEGQRLVLLTLLVFSLFFARLVDFPRQLPLRLGVLLLCLLIIAIMLPTTLRQTHAWVNEQAQNGLYQQIYDGLDQFGPGRAINYGVFAYATEPLIPIRSKNLWMITHTSSVGTRTIPQYELKDGSESSINIDNNITYVVNRMRTTFTRYVIIFKGTQGGDFTHTLIGGYLQTTLNVSPVYDAAQLSIWVIPDSYYIESVIPAKTTLNKTQLYSAQDGWRAYTFKIPQVPDDYGITLESPADIPLIPYPTPYRYQIVSPGEMDIYGNFTGGWIIVKDHYFPTWHATMNGHELRIEESNLGTLLIKTEPGSTIYLRHEPFPFEPILSVLAILALVGVCVAPVFWKRVDGG